MKLERARPETCLSDLALDLLLAGEGDRTHLASCVVCRARLDELRHEQEMFLRDAPEAPEPEPQAVVVPLQKKRRWIAIAAPLAAAAALLLAVLQAQRQPDTTRFKGGFAIGFYADRAGEVRLGANGETLSPGDRIRFWYSSERRGYLAILSYDAANKISRYHPAQGDTAAAANEGREVLLDSAALLDETLGAEVIRAFWCDAPASLAALENALKNDAPPPEGCTSDQLRIEKKR